MTETSTHQWNFIVTESLSWIHSRMKNSIPLNNTVNWKENCAFLREHRQLFSSLRWLRIYHFFSLTLNFILSVYRKKDTIVRTVILEKDNLWQAIPSYFPKITLGNHRIEQWIKIRFWMVIMQQLFAYIVSFSRLMAYGSKQLSFHFAEHYLSRSS